MNQKILFVKLKFEGKVAARPDMEEGECLLPGSHIWIRQAAHSFWFEVSLWKVCLLVCCLIAVETWYG
jgi:hypothetical protein